MNGEWVAQAVEIQKKFSALWTLDTRDLSRPDAEKVLAELIPAQPADLAQRLHQEFFGAGPLEPLLDQTEVSEIIVNGPNDIWFERGGRFHRHPDQFFTSNTFHNAMDRICAEAGLTVNLAEPFADGRWRDFRLHAARTPLTNCEFHLSLRRIARAPWTLTRLRELKWASDEQFQQLQGLMGERKNILFIGPTGSGKTSALSAALQSIPDHERAVILEDTDELPVPNSASTKLLTRNHTTAALRPISLDELVKQSLRMRPERLIVGEVRGGEAKDLLLALATGHSGSLGTLHAADARQALIRLEMLVQLGAPQWGLTAIRQLIHFSVDALAVCEFTNGHRRLQGLYKVAALESFGLLIDQIA